jgi:ABC-type oligopeptide transport system ATPase subunit
MTGNGQDVKPLLDVQELKTAFFTRQGVVKAVNGVSFTVMPGETLDLVGESGCESGCGKTTVANLILLVAS